MHLGERTALDQFQVNACALNVYVEESKALDVSVPWGNVLRTVG